MKLNAQFNKRVYNENGESEITLTVSNYRHQQYITELNTDDNYSVEIKKVKSKRSLEQNKLLWAMIKQLSIKTREDDMNIYCKLLIESNAKFFYIAAIESAYEELLKSHRAVMKFGKVIITNENGKETPGIRYKVFYGSSKFTIEEMNTLIETCMLWCENEEIHI